MSRRSRCWRGHETIADCGLWIADWQIDAPLVESAIDNPQSAIGGRDGGGAVKYFVTLGAQTVEVEVDGDRVLVGGEAVDVHLAPLAGTPLYHLLPAGASWTVAAQPLEGDGRWAMGVVGERVEVAVPGERARGAGEASGTGAGPSDAGPAGGGAPMPGMVGRGGGVGGQRGQAGG